MSKVKPTYPLFLLEEYFGTLEYLRLLLQEGKLYNEQIKETLGLNHRTIENARGNLISAKLITTEWGDYQDQLGKSHRVLFSILTPSGKEIAEKIIEIEKILIANFKTEQYE